MIRSWSAGSPRTINPPTAPQPKPSTESCIPVRPKTRNCIAIPPTAYTQLKGGAGPTARCCGAATFSVVAMTRCAFFGVDHSALRGRAAALRQSGAIGQDADVPGSDGSLVDRLAEIGRLGQ